MTPATAMMGRMKRYLLLAAVAAAVVRWVLDGLDYPEVHRR